MALSPDAGGDRNVGAYHSVCAEHTLVNVGDVHGAALALVGAGGLAQQFGHHLLEVNTLGDAVVVAAVRAENVVVVAEVGADARGHRLLAYGRVHTAQLARVRLASGLLLESAYRDHGPVHPQERIFIQFRIDGAHNIPPWKSLSMREASEPDAARDILISLDNYGASVTTIA